MSTCHDISDFHVDLAAQDLARSAAVLPCLQTDHLSKAELANRPQYAYPSKDYVKIWAPRQ